jgi:hypothetical protein
LSWNDLDCPTGLDERFAPDPSAFVAQRRAAHRRTRRNASARIATKGGDGHAGVKRALSVRAPASANRSNGGKLDAFGGHSTAEAYVKTRYPEAAIATVFRAELQA